MGTYIVDDGTVEVVHNRGSINAMLGIVISLPDLLKAVIPKCHGEFDLTLDCHVSAIFTVPPWILSWWS